MRFRFIWMSVIALACSQRPATPERDRASSVVGEGVSPIDARRNADTGQIVDAGGSSDESLEERFRGFGMRFARSPGDDRLTSLVTEHMRKAKVPLPPNPRFFISKRSDDWVVSVMDVDAIRHGKKPAGRSYHISDQNGELRILFGEAGD